jgi:hypothetical protein
MAQDSPSIINRRSVAVSAGVLCFFAIGIIGSFGGLSPCTCSQRAVLGAAVAYLATGTAVRAINSILTQAMIASQVKKREKPVDSESEAHAQNH